LTAGTGGSGLAGTSAKGGGAAGPRLSIYWALSGVRQVARPSLAHLRWAGCEFLCWIELDGFLSHPTSCYIKHTTKNAP